MARDRKRGRRRSSRPDEEAGNAGLGGDDAGTGGVGSGDLSREVGLDDATIDRAGLGEGTPAPDPLKNVSAEVDQARIAEAGSGRGASGDIPDEVEGDIDYLPAPDEVEGDALVARRGEVDPAVEEERAAARAGKDRSRVVAFLGHCIDELRRVQWPDRRQVGQATAVVLGFVVIAGGYLGLMDAIWKPLVNAIL